ncbi:hypothetical protein ACIA5G_17165 [Amycolatopsis sp. NPDC051758]|uniref:hypothetical protein n=1 Tax=Amycolatopsis sp. NPDC051758 TaxID=3363935 RepID=UPI0037BA67DA
MPFLLVPCRSPGQAARWLAVMLAFVPLILVVACEVPAIVVSPFVPSMRCQAKARSDRYIQWTRTILDALGTAAAPPDPPVLPVQRTGAERRDVGRRP